MVKEKIAHIISLILKTESFKDLPVGWDSYDSKPPSRLSIDKTQYLILLSSSKELYVDNVVPSVEGGIGIIFREKNLYADIEIYNNGEACYVCSRGKRDWVVNETHDFEDFITMVSTFLKCGILPKKEREGDSA